MTTTISIDDPRTLRSRSRPAPGQAAADELSQTVGYERIEQLNGDPDLSFQLRGHGWNPLVDGAQPLLGLVIRLRRLERCDDIGKLYQTVRDQISALDEEIRQHSYDSATQLAFRYALCAFIDEAVMATPWGGSDSVWAKRSLLSHFHNETWGGEKFFTVLTRMLVEPAKYRDVLEFKYLCLCLGFTGKYGVRNNRDESLNHIIDRLHHVLRGLRGDVPEKLTDGGRNIATRRYRLGGQLPWWTPWACALVLLTGAYTYFSVQLNSSTGQVLRALDATLKR
ncbi:type IVB secretion system protein IcmH/DotU [Burkholderia cepacia]|uniref:type IVB secretion system protein IcmH/DotU n=1 Tax=Burkholderia cepacia TaxID=292 RepID=UPI001CF47373|nr:type IVB secretion system protein IcmH/DotU [Burkholderia cepacia]MCA8115540.1 type IVB secretion system protein IcmH/DotU [Burkholderia cepacia]MCA8402511.1 type IVB secretion system protein IcmH/DotU [Burkholderia cepacia]